jgi:hypothetical protein
LVAVSTGVLVAVSAGVLVAVLAGVFVGTLVGGLQFPANRTEPLFVVEKPSAHVELTVNVTFPDWVPGYVLCACTVPKGPTSPLTIFGEELFMVITALKSLWIVQVTVWVPLLQEALPEICAACADATLGGMRLVNMDAIINAIPNMYERFPKLCSDLKRKRRIFIMLSLDRMLKKQ